MYLGPVSLVPNLSSLLSLAGDADTIREAVLTPDCSTMSLTILPFLSLKIALPVFLSRLLIRLFTFWKDTIPSLLVTNLPVRLGIVVSSEPAIDFLALFIALVRLLFFKNCITPASFTFS